MRIHTRARLLLAIPVAFCSLFAGGAVRRAQDVCGPFTDVSPAFCPYVLEMYYLGITAGTSPTTFSPDATITRGQAAVFVAKGVNQSIARSSRRAALGQWWIPTGAYDAVGKTPVGAHATRPVADGADIWVPSPLGSVSRVRASDGKLLETWTGAIEASEALVALGRVFIASRTVAGDLYMIDPSQPAGPVTTVATGIADGPMSIAFDGTRIWTANPGLTCACEPQPFGSVSIITPGSWTVENLESGFEYPSAILFDGTNIWVMDQGKLHRLDSTGAITQTIPGMGYPSALAFDGTNIWVPFSGTNTVNVVRASTGEIVASLTANNVGDTASFDGSRILTGLELWDAQNLKHLGSVEVGGQACSDGINFWVSGGNPGFLFRL